MMIVAFRSRSQASLFLIINPCTTADTRLLTVVGAWGWRVGEWMARSWASIHLAVRLVYPFPP